MKRLDNIQGINQENNQFKGGIHSMKRMSITGIIAVLALLLVGSASATVVLDNIDGYATNDALTSVWLPDQVTITGVSLESTIVKAGAGALKINYNMGVSPWWGDAYRSFSPVKDISGEQFLTFWTRGNSGFLVQLHTVSQSRYSESSTWETVPGATWQRNQINLAILSTQGFVWPSGAGYFATMTTIDRIKVLPKDTTYGSGALYVDEIEATKVSPVTIIDNFNTYADTSALQAVWSVFGSATAVKLETTKIVEGSGAMAFDYNLWNSPWFGNAFRSFSPALNFSNSTNLLLYMQDTHNSNCKTIQVQLVSANGYSSSPRLVQQRRCFRNVAIPLNSFIKDPSAANPVDLSAVIQIKIMPVYWSGSDAGNGTMIIDQIAVDGAVTAVNDWSIY